MQEQMYRVMIHPRGSRICNAAEAVRLMRPSGAGISCAAIGRKQPIDGSPGTPKLNTDYLVHTAKKYAKATTREQL